jgi:hypothetical membrane protein
MTNNLRQLLNSLVIITGAVLLVYSLLEAQATVYYKVTGLVLIMIGAYRASNHWVAHRDDHLNDEEE